MIQTEVADNSPPAATWVKEFLVGTRRRRTGSIIERQKYCPLHLSTDLKKKNVITLKPFYQVKKQRLPTKE